MRTIGLDLTVQTAHKSACSLQPIYDARLERLMSRDATTPRGSE